MINPPPRTVRFLVACCLALLCGLVPLNVASSADPTSGLTERISWQNERLQGSPEPPLPYTTAPAFEDIDWDRPIYAKAEPGTANLLVVQLGSSDQQDTTIVRIDEHDPTRLTDVLTIPGRVVYGIEFDPNYRTNGLLYVFSNGPTGNPERRNRIARFQLDADTGRFDPSTELNIINWRSMGHDGGELAFGADGMLYISTGDGTSDSDKWLSGQDITNLLGGVLRIDVRQASSESPYTVPADNPFVATEGARAELWAFGLRNPWRLWSDKDSGQIWVGNNGQDLWETVHLIRRGENYGWSVYEGSHPFYPQRQRGPAEITPPTLEHHHTESRSLTGGVVYRGKELPELDGAYIYGDYSTGKIWGARHDGTKVTWHQELADTSHQIAGFAIAPSGALLIVDHGGGLHRLKPSPPVTNPVPFPRKLSQTALFDSVADHQLNPGIIPYSINAPGWHDGATAQRFLAVPGNEQIGSNGIRGWNLPNGSVILQTLSLPHGDSSTRIETRLMVRQQQEWAGYSYRWNREQTDATLVSKSGADLELELPNNTSKTWRIPSRAECMSCHSRAVNFVLGLSDPQLNRDHDYGSVAANQLDTLRHIGLLKDGDPPEGPTLIDPYDQTQPVDARARSYLHVNCSCCHVEAGGGNARMELEFNRSLKDMRVVSARPQHATFGITNAMLVAPSVPDRSVLLQRVSRRGAGQMPPLFSKTVDQTAVDLLRNWIASIPSDERKFVRRWTTSDVLAELQLVSRPVSTERGKQLYSELGCIQCHRVGEEGGGAGPDLTTVAKRLKRHALIQAIVDPSAQIAPEYSMTIVTTADGRTLTGRIEHEDDQRIRLRPPESFNLTFDVDKQQIEDRALSTVSLMPADILNTCTAEEIVDLISYLETRDGANP